MPKKKHQPPAKIKYDKTHPVKSIRVNQDLEKKLDEIKELSGKMRWPPFLGQDRGCIKSGHRYPQGVWC